LCIHAAWLRSPSSDSSIRLHAVSGLLALDEIEEAKEFLHVLESTHAAIRDSLDARIQVPTIAGLVLAETVVAAQRGITLAIDEASRLRRLPALVSDTQAVTIVGNLLDNAFDAVANMAPERRHVRLRLDDDGGRTAIEVTDRGEGLPAEELALFDRGVSTKAGHRGLGLALVHEAVTAAMGTIEVRRRAEGTSFLVTIDG
jgi:CitB family two-component system sensor histidine kinase CitS